MQGKEGFANHECTIELSDNTERDYSISARPLFDKSGEFSGYRGVARDITQRKRIERELEQTSANLVSAESKGRQKAEETATALSLRPIAHWKKPVLIITMRQRIPGKVRNLKFF